MPRHSGLLNNLGKLIAGPGERIRATGDVRVVLKSYVTIKSKLELEVARVRDTEEKPRCLLGRKMFRVGFCSRLLRSARRGSGGELASRFFALDEV